MFRFDHRRDEQRRKERELLRNIKMNEKPKFNDLLAIMFAQYLIILPIAFIGMIVFSLVLRALLSFWGN